MLPKLFLAIFNFFGGPHLDCWIGKVSIMNNFIFSSWLSNTTRLHKTSVFPYSHLFWGHLQNKKNNRILIATHKIIQAVTALTEPRSAPVPYCILYTDILPSTPVVVVFVFRSASASGAICACVLLRDNTSRRCRT
jgi:hypothetical protein